MKFTEKILIENIQVFLDSLDSEKSNGKGEDLPKGISNNSSIIYSINDDAENLYAPYFDDLYQALKVFHESPEILEKLMINFFSLKILDLPKRLASVSESFFDQLAESYVKGKRDTYMNQLFKEEHQLFIKNIKFYNTLQNVLKLEGRINLRNKFSEFNDISELEVPNQILKSVAKKQQREELKDMFDKWEGEKPSKKPIVELWTKYSGVAAILICVLLIWQPTKMSNESLFNQYKEDAPNFLIAGDNLLTKPPTQNSDVRGLPDDFQGYTFSEKKNIFSGIDMMSTGKYESALNEFSKIKNTKDGDLVKLFVGISLVNINQVEKASEILFSFRENSSGEFQAEANFHLAMCYLKLDKRSEARLILEDLVNDEGLYSQPSSKILKKLRWF